MPNKKNRKRWLWQSAIVLLVVAVGVYLRLLFFQVRGTYTFDEAFVAYFSQSWERLRKIVMYENNPPLYFFLYVLWKDLLHLPSAPTTFSFVISIFQLFAAYFVARKLYPDRQAIGLICLVLTAISPYLIMNASYGRIYSLLTLLAYFYLYYSMRALRGERVFAGLVVSGILLSLVHVYGVIPIIVTGIFLLVKLPRSRRALMATGLSLFPFALWFGGQLYFRGIGSLEGAIFLMMPPWIGLLLNVPTFIFTGLIQMSVMRFMGALIVFMVYSFPFIFRSRRWQWEDLLYYGVQHLSVVAVSLLIGMDRESYFSGIAPVLILAAAYILSYRPLKGLGLVGLVVLMLTSSFLQLRCTTPCYEKAAAIIREVDPEIPIYVVPFYLKIVPEQYLQTERPILGLGQRNPDLDTAIILENWLWTLRGDQATVLVGEIQEDQAVVFISESVFNDAGRLLSAFGKHGFVVEKTIMIECSPTNYFFYIKKEPAY